MKKKIIEIITVTGIFILFFAIIYKILPVENIKKSFQINTAKISGTNEVTIVDITNLNSSIDIEHEHIYITKHNEEKHWKECKICSKKQNIENHIYVDGGWSMGNSCSESNVHKYTCQCGYSYTTTNGRKSHNLKTDNYVDSFRQVARCYNECGYSIFGHNCYKSNGSRISCSNLGTCVTCKFNYTTSNSMHMAGKRNIKNSEECKCQNCSLTFATLNYYRVTKISNNSYKLQGSITAKNGVSFTRIDKFDSFGGNSTISNEKNVTSGTTWTVERTVTFNEYRENGGLFQDNFLGKLSSGMQVLIVARADIGYLDSEEPVISNIVIGEDEENIIKWNKNKMLTISGTENYCKTVTLEILNDKGDSIYKGSGNVIDNKYSISCILDIEADATGKRFTAVITDSCNNTITQEFTISKVDSISPTPASENEVGGDWAKTKNFTFKATDEGIGNVQIAFNDISDLASATLNESGEYEREYEFTGDVYSSKELSVLYKDELGNTTIQKVTIDKLDNTAPTITDTNIHNNKLTVEANDIKEGMGEGSGITKYRYITSEEKLENPKVSETATEVNVGEDFIISNIDKVKYIYIVAEDLVRKCK